MKVNNKNDISQPGSWTPPARKRLSWRVNCRPFWPPITMTNRSAKTNATLIAPCGLNCRLCRSYIKARKTCPGCRGDDALKSHACAACRIKNCGKLTRRGIRFCFSCDEFPCASLRHLDVRYRTRYGISPMENLRSIAELGIRQFVRLENRRWVCPDCGGMLCVHKVQCPSCGKPATAVHTTNPV